MVMEGGGVGGWRGRECEVCLFCVMFGGNSIFLTCVRYLKMG